MTLKTFIERPILSAVISIVIVLAGVLGLASLSIEQYPDIAPPTVMVNTAYPGASAETVQKAVFIPVSMMGGTSGIFYTQFGITMAVAVGISALNALTLSPALCAILLKPYIGEDGKEVDNFSNRFRKAFNASFTAVVDRYKYGVLFFVRRR